MLDGATIVIRDGQIRAVGVDVDAPTGAKQIDLTGKTVYAGFVEAFTEIDIKTDPPGPAHWNKQVTPQRTAGASYRPDKKLDKSLRGQGFTARLVVPKKGVLKGASCVALIDGGPASESLIARQVAIHLKLTIPFGRGGENSSYPNSPMGAVALARQALLDAAWHRDVAVAALSDPTAQPPAANLALAALTTAPSELLGVGQRLGTIEKGKLANFVVADGDLFTTDAKVLSTWVAGQEFEIEAPTPGIVGSWKLAARGIEEPVVLRVSGERANLKATIGLAVDGNNDREEEKLDPQVKIKLVVNYPLGMYGRANEPAQPKATLFKNATIWTCGKDGLLDRADVLVRNTIERCTAGAVCTRRRTCSRQVESDATRWVDLGRHVGRARRGDARSLAPGQAKGTRRRPRQRQKNLFQGRS